MSVTRTDSRPRVVVRQHSKDGAAVDVTSNVRTLTTHADYAASGRYTLALHPHRSVNYLAFRPDDWVEVYGYVNGLPEELLMWGPLDSVTRVRARGGAGPIESISLAGQNFAKVMRHTQVFADPILDTAVETATIFNNLATMNSLGPLKAGEVVKTLISAIVGINKKYEFLLPDGRSLFDYGVLNLSEHVSDDTDGALLVDPNIPLGGDLWSLLQRFSDPTNNYLYVDVQRRKGGPISGEWEPYLALGRLPYSLATFRARRTYALDARDEVTSQEVGFYDADLRNWFRVYPAQASIPAMMDAMALASGVRTDLRSVAKHGIRRHEPQALYATPFRTAKEDSTEDSVIGVCDKQVDQIAKWYIGNEHMLSGTINCKFRPDIRVGGRLVLTDTYTDERIEFFIEAVTHNWTYDPPQSSTVLQVTRGVTSEIVETVKDAQDSLTIIKFEE